MASYEGKHIDKTRGMGFRVFLAILHLVFAVWLIITALSVLVKPLIYPWWLMDINMLSSGILLAIGISSFMIFFNFIKAANIHRILALVNIILLTGFSLYLSQFLISVEFDYSMFFFKLYNNYSFGIMTLSLFTFIVAIPNILTFFSRPAGEKKKGVLVTALLVLIIVSVSLGGYYLYLNKQKGEMLAEEFGKNNEYKLYNTKPDPTSYYGTHPYFLDSYGDTTGHYISEDKYRAIQFLRTKDTGKVLAWWDFELEIKAAGKEPVISYASKAINLTIARPASLYDIYEPDEKVADVSRFFTTDSEDVAKSIAEKYGAGIVYISRQEMDYLFQVMFFTANPEYNLQSSTDIQNPEIFKKKIYEPSMAYKFNNGEELKHFKKIFENKDIYIYKIS